VIVSHPWSQNGTLKKPQTFQFLNQSFVSITTYSNESWVMTKRVLFQVQVEEMGFLGRVHSATLQNRVRSSEIHKTLNVEPCTSSNG